MESQNSSSSRFIFYVLYFTFFISSCSITKQISTSAKQSVLKDSSLLTAHIGISIYEPATGKYWYNYNGEKYFVPASNTKIPTCYAAMKYLGDSLVGARYKMDDSSITVFPSGDPTFLHSDFSYQPFFNKLKRFKKVIINDNAWEDEPLGSGWSWNDYNQDYMAERSSFPIYGNLLKFTLKDSQIEPLSNMVVIKADLRFESPIEYDAITKKVLSNKFRIERSLDENIYFIKDANSDFSTDHIPIRTNSFIYDLLRDTLKLEDAFGLVTDPPSSVKNNGVKIHSQPTDSLLKPMMHRSDNFFAEQSLLMVSNEMLGVMNDAKIIDTLLKTDLKDLPQKPRWVDGSGLSRYNLFTPQDFVVILNKMKNEFGMNRIKEIFPTGGEGTISSYYKADSSYIYAKTGSLSGVVALSGYLTTKKNKELIFSILVNNHQASATAVRRAVEKFIQGLRDKY